tara:strand:+ start:18046 stop:18399 length:354 start_codon:yes stop_codon:yes gene_type:complete
MTINVSEALDMDTGEIITVERTTGSEYVDGRYVKGTVTSFKTLASVQQPSPKDLENLPEGERNKDLLKFISKKPILTTSDKDSIIADTAIYKGKRYKIIKSGDWDTYGHTTSFGVRD